MNPKSRKAWSSEMTATISEAYRDIGESLNALVVPVGLAFEQYDAIGRWRAKIGEQPVDTAGALPDGRRFEDALELIDLLRERKTEFAKQVTRAMLTYALGRGLEPYDQCAVETILATLKQNGYRSRTLVREIVLSDPFQMRRGDGGMP